MNPSPARTSVTLPPGLVGAGLLSDRSSRGAMNGRGSAWRQSSGIEAWRGVDRDRPGRVRGDAQLAVADPQTAVESPLEDDRSPGSDSTVDAPGLGEVTSVANGSSGPNQRWRLPSACEELTFPGDPLATTAVARRAAGSGRPHRCLGDDPAAGPLRHLEPFRSSSAPARWVWLTRHRSSSRAH